jgi:hypothetical protein
MDLNILSRVFDPTLTLERLGSRAKVGPEAEASGRESAQEEPKPSRVCPSDSAPGPFHAPPGFTRPAPGKTIIPGGSGRPDDPRGILAAQIIH